MIRALLLSRFDDRIGPVIFYSIPSIKGETLEHFSNVPRLMDIIEGGNYFTHAINNIYTANHYFELPAQSKRGKKESVLLSIVFRVPVQDEGWVRKIVGFLQGQKDVLSDLASTFKHDEEINRSGLFDPANEIHVKKIMYSFYTRIFVQDARNLLEENVVRHTIWVMCARKLNWDAALCKIKETVQRSPGSVKKELLEFLLSRLNFSEFNCESRADRSIECPVCDRRYIESAACLFIYDVDDGDAKGEMEDVVAHVNNLGVKSTNPFLILGLDDGEHEHTGLSRMLDMAILSTARKAPSLPVSNTTVSIDNIDTYYTFIKWLLSAILL